MSSPLRHAVADKFCDPADAPVSAQEPLRIARADYGSGTWPLDSNWRESLPNRLLTDGSAAPQDILVALSYGLELVRHGAILVSHGAQPRLINRRAMAILRKRDGIGLGPAGLAADRASDSRLLLRLLEHAIADPGSGEPPESPLTLPRLSTPSALIVRVVPGPALQCWPGAGGRTALVKLYDQDLGMVVDEGALVSLYGLTRGEAALAGKLVQGKTIETAASELFISGHTARTHLKRIFMKTNTHRQPELVVRMLPTVL